jgi:hypothetical protein
MDLNLFNQIVTCLLILVLLFIAVERMQKELINNKPKSNHDKKLQDLDKLSHKLEYYKQVLNDKSLTDEQKVKWLEIELHNYNK